MRGVNGQANGIKGALKFQVRVACRWPRRNNFHRTGFHPVANADSATLVIAAATSYKNYHDVSGDPEAIAKKQHSSAGKNVTFAPNCSRRTSPNIRDYSAASP